MGDHYWDFRASVSDRENFADVLRETRAACTHASHRAIVQKQSFVSYIAIALAGGSQAGRLRYRPVFVEILVCRVAKTSAVAKNSFKVLKYLIYGGLAGQRYGTHRGRKPASKGLPRYQAKVAIDAGPRN